MVYIVNSVKCNLIKYLHKVNEVLHKIATKKFEKKRSRCMYLIAAVNYIKTDLLQNSN